MMTRALLLGCGAERTVKVCLNGKLPDEIVRLDSNPAHKPDLVWDLNAIPWKIQGYLQNVETKLLEPFLYPIPDDSYDEIHAYEILEHLGTQGDVKSFFDTFFECWRILKPNGLLVASIPRWDSMWAWGDPGHRRVINEGSLVFLDQSQYEKQVGRSPMSDYRSLWRGDFERLGLEQPPNIPDLLWFVLRARK